MIPQLLVALALFNGAAASSFAEDVKSVRRLQYGTNCGAESVGEWIEGEIVLDVIDTYFLLNGVFPTDVDCAPFETDICISTIYLDANPNATNATDLIASALDSYAVSEPCTRCNYEYPLESTAECNTLSCDQVTCLPSIDQNGTVPFSVNFCKVQTRYDSFSSNEVRTTNNTYGCFQQTAKKVYSVEYEVGVQNVEQSLFIVQDTLEEVDDDELEVCDFVIDGETCNSCRFCREDEAGFGYVQVDCSNIQEGATTSCESFSDVLFGINPVTGISTKLLILQEGYVHTEPPTIAPTTEPPTAMPTDAFRGPGMDGESQTCSHLLVFYDIFRWSQILSVKLVFHIFVDKLIVDAGHDECVLFEGRSQQFYGDELDPKECTPSLISTSLVLYCSKNKFAEDPLEEEYEAACEAAGGFFDKAELLRIVCYGDDGMYDYYESKIKDDNVQSLSTSFGFEMLECYKNAQCAKTYSEKDNCDVNVGYQKWYANYLEDLYKAAGLPDVTCNYEPISIQNEGCVNEGKSDATSVGGLVASFVPIFAFMLLQ